MEFIKDRSNPEDYGRAFAGLVRGQKVPGDPAFYVAAPKASGPVTTGSAEGFAVTVLVPVPILDRRASGDWNQHAARLKSTVLSRFNESATGLAADQVKTETVFTPLDWRALFGLYDGSAFGAAHTLGQMGPFRPRNYGRRIRGLYFTGANTTPGTGVPTTSPREPERLPTKGLAAFDPSGIIRIRSLRSEARLRTTFSGSFLAALLVELLIYSTVVLGGC